MSDVSTPLPDDIDALRTLVQRQATRLAQHEAEREQHHSEIERQRTALAKRDAKIESLQEQMLLLLAQRFDASSEKTPEAQLRLFNEAERVLEAQDEDEERAEIEVPAHRRRRGGRRPLPEALPRIEVIHDLQDHEEVCPHDGVSLKPIGEAVTDNGYGAYDTVCAHNPGIVPVGCFAHARRKLNAVFKAVGVNSKKLWPKGKSPPAKLRRAAKGLRFIQQLFAIEHRIRDHGPEQRNRVRYEENQAVLGKLRQWVTDILPEVAPSTALGDALGYLDRQWPKLARFLDDGRLEMHADRVENAIRPFVTGRKAWLFADTVARAKASANLYSLVETARLNGLNPYLYLKHVFIELPKAQMVEDIEARYPTVVTPQGFSSSPSERRLHVNPVLHEALTQ